MDLKSKHDEFTISTDKTLLDEKMIADFLARESYWAQSRTSDQALRAINNSLSTNIAEYSKRKYRNILWSRNLRSTIPKNVVRTG